MDWEQKLDALNALCGHQLIMRKPGNWYVEANKEAKDGSILRGAYGNGATPQEAVEDDWRQYVEELSIDQYIVIHAGRNTRREVRWNGYMWVDMPKPEKVA